MQLKRAFKIGLMLAVSVAASAQTPSEEQSLVASFKVVSNDFLKSLVEKQGCHTRLASPTIPDWWYKECHKFDVDGAKIDVQKTTSLVSPYVGSLVVGDIISNTTRQKTEPEASADNVITHTREKIMEYSFGYQDGKWRFVSSHVVSDSDAD